LNQLGSEYFIFLYFLDAQGIGSIFLVICCGATGEGLV